MSGPWDFLSIISPGLGIASSAADLLATPDTIAASPYEQALTVSATSSIAADARAYNLTSDRWLKGAIAVLLLMAAWESYEKSQGRDLKLVDPWPSSANPGDEEDSE